MANKLVARTRDWLDVGPFAWKVLIAIVVLSWGGPYAMKLVRLGSGAGPQPSRSALYTYYGRRGPWVGWMSADGLYHHHDEAIAQEVQPGEIVVWESNSEYGPGINSSWEFRLWCSGREVYVEDGHLYADQRRSGWKTFGLHVPRSAKPGEECGIRIHTEFRSETGQEEVKDSPTIPIRIAGAPSAPALPAKEGEP